jgi:hypothetical protein
MTTALTPPAYSAVAKRLEVDPQVGVRSKSPFGVGTASGAVTSPASTKAPMKHTLRRTGASYCCAAARVYGSPVRGGSSP